MKLIKLHLTHLIFTRLMLLFLSPFQFSVSVNYIQIYHTHPHTDQYTKTPYNIQLWFRCSIKRGNVVPCDSCRV